MSVLVILCFVVGMTVEMFSLAWLADQISTINTISEVMFTILFGVVVGRSWRPEWYDKMQWHLKSKTLPPDEVLTGTVMVTASTLLMTPGVVTDIVGFLILFPPTRGIFKILTLQLAKIKISSGSQYYFFKG